MNIFALIELILQSIGLWDGLKTYVNDQELQRMRRDLLKLHETQELIEKANNEADIYSAQSSVTRSTD